MKLNNLYRKYGSFEPESASWREKIRFAKESTYRHNLSKYFPGKNKRYLDIGPGDGALLKIWKDLGIQEFEGVDISETVYNNLKKQGFKCHLVKSTEKFLAKRKNYYDCITAIEVLEHLERNSIFNFTQKIYYALKQDGCFIAGVPNAQYPDATVIIYNDITHRIGAFTERSLFELLTACGFSRVSFLPIKMPFALTQNFFYNLLSFLPKHIFREIYYFLAKTQRFLLTGMRNRIMTPQLFCVAYKIVNENQKREKTKF